MAFNKKYVEINTIKLVHQSLHSELCPKCLPVELVKRGKKLCLLQQEPKIKQWKSTFQQKATVYNELLDNFEICCNKVLNILQRP